MGMPQVVIVGRPNVGKSSLFNWLVGRRIAIVDPTSGVTRDRVTQLVEIEDRFIELVDTGGMGVRDADNLTAQIEHQIQLAIDAADLILFVVDTREGVTPLDQKIDQRLRALDVPVLCVANKADSAAIERHADEFYRFGRKVLVVSAQERRGKDELLLAIREQLPPAEEDEATGEPIMKLAIVGRRNVGKSTFVNTLAKSERMIVSEVPGTTRDSVDVRFELDGKAFMAIDTPGFRRVRSMSGDLDYYSTHRAQRSIRRADVVLFFFDAEQTISKTDKQLCEYIVEEHKPCIFVVNKWDLLVDKARTSQWAEYLHDTLPMTDYMPVAFITGQTGKNVKLLLNHAQMLYKQSLVRTPTARLNKVVRAAMEKNPPPLYRNRRAKVFYAAQVAVQPPTIVLFASSPKALSQQYQRYLLGVLRDNLECGEVPIKLHIRQRASSDNRDDIESKLKR